MLGSIRTVASSIDFWLFKSLSGKHYIGTTVVLFHEVQYLTLTVFASFISNLRSSF